MSRPPTPPRERAEPEALAAEGSGAAGSRAAAADNYGRPPPPRPRARPDRHRPTPGSVVSTAPRLPSRLVRPTHPSPEAQRYRRSCGPGRDERVPPRRVSPVAGAGAGRGVGSRAWRRGRGLGGGDSGRSPFTSPVAGRGPDPAGEPPPSARGASGSSPLRPLGVGGGRRPGRGTRAGRGEARRARPRGSPEGSGRAAAPRRGENPKAGPGPRRAAMDYVAPLAVTALRLGRRHRFLLGPSRPLHTCRFGPRRPPASPRA